MSQYPINVLQRTATEPRHNLVYVAESPALPAAPGALGLRVNHAAWSASAHMHPLGELAGANISGNVTASQAQSALDNLLDALPSGTPLRPTLSQFLNLDTETLSSMVNGLLQEVYAKNADILCQQIQRASDVQEVLRDKQLKDYQAQINKAGEQADKVRKAGIFSAVCDWIISGVQLAVGVLRVMAGDVVGGTATILNGVDGILKACAETALLCGADKEVCSKIILAATVLQTLFSAIAMIGGISVAANAKGVGQAAMRGSKYINYLSAGNEGIGSVNQIQKSGTSMTVADLQQQIEKLMADQSFNDGVQRWVETRKSEQYQKLWDTYKDSVQARKNTLHIMDNYGTALAQVVSVRA